MASSEKIAQYFSPWDIVAGNFVAEFASEHEALLFVREVVGDGQRDLVEGWALGWGDDAGNRAAIAQGGELAELALSVTASPPSSLPG